ncbi:MAG: CHAT domain-containing protein, partial [Saprospiraceae bacterium]
TNREYFEIALWAANQLQELTQDPTLTERAFQYAELARERLLIEQMQDREKAAMASEATRRQLASLRERRTSLQTLYFESTLFDKSNKRLTDSLETLLFDTHLSWKNLLKSIEPPKDKNAVVRLPSTDLVALKKLLPDNQALLEYFTGDSAIYVFILTNRGLQFFQSPRPQDLHESIQNLRESLTIEKLRNRQQNFLLFSESAAKLYNALLSNPLNALPPSVNHLAIIPDGELYDVPFELLSKANDTKNFKDFPYLLRHYTISYANSGSLLLKQSESASKAKTPGSTPFMAFAAQYSTSDHRNKQLQSKGLKPFDDMPISRNGTKKIAETLQGGRAYLGLNANKSQFKKQASQGQILHLAMHTQIEGNDPMFSKFLFTQTEKDPAGENDLYAIELYDLQLNAKMAVLGACETGLGQVRQGEGVMSLARAFAYTGVPASVVSLWMVKDGPTNDLMLGFYEQLKTGARKDDALRQAKLNYLEKQSLSLANPYFWGGFIASGNMEPLFEN